MTVREILELLIDVKDIIGQGFILPQNQDQRM